MNETKKIENGWSYDEILKYNVEILDTNALYGIEMEIQHSTLYNFQNIYVNIETTFPNGQSIKESVSVDLADKKGKWYGSGGESKSVVVDLQEAAFFEQAGDYSFKLSQHTRDENLEGIEAIRFGLRELNESRTAQ